MIFFIFDLNKNITRYISKQWINFIYSKNFSIKLGPFKFSPYLNKISPEDKISPLLTARNKIKITQLKFEKGN